MKTILKKAVLILLILLVVLAIYLFVGRPPQAKNITWGIDFSQKHARDMGLDWKEVYLAYLEDLGAREIKLSTAWDLLEPEMGSYNFADLDWQIDQAERYGAKIILVIGMRTPRWPECHFPDWAKDLPKEERQQAVLKLLEKAVSRYQKHSSIWAWQVENEPLFPFGECPKPDKRFLKQEIALVKSLDLSKRPVIITDSGEWSSWLRVAGVGSDIIGTTLYRRVWQGDLGMYIDYPFSPIYYYRKAELIKKLFNKEVICVELQAEPWGPKLLYDISLEEQKKSMDLTRFSGNIEFAKKTGLDTFYLWGGEWWYWMKETQGDDSFWNQAKELFSQ
ncbi:beta-galactosidase [Candidatus Parcubacteria bacterium]|nr:beta-galactosidase [Patescibacteria group bacterium]MBU4467050.1 beta-galactosidase [Patescibacteria group bacterium]MCG2688394.1 beta-galactosidase [Candidatus Parcubacteria bacterium]